jgi:hypothetical protein
MEEELTIQEQLNKIDLLLEHKHIPENREFINFNIFEEVKNEKMVNIPNYGDVIILKSQEMNEYKSEIKKLERQIAEILAKVTNLCQTLAAKEKQLKLISIEKDHLNKEFLAQTAKFENLLKKNGSQNTIQFPQAQFFINASTTNIFSNVSHEQNSHNNNNDQEILNLKKELEILHNQLKESTEKEKRLSSELISKSIEATALQKENDRLKLSLQSAEKELENSLLSINHLKKSISEKSQFVEKIKVELDNDLKEAKKEMIGSQDKWTDQILNLSQIQDLNLIEFPYYTETQARIQLKVENELLREKLTSLEEELKIERNNNLEIKKDFDQKAQDFETIKENILKNLENSVLAIERETIEKFDGWVNNNKEAYATWDKIKELQENLNTAFANLEFQKKINFEIKLKLDFEIEEKTRLLNNNNELEQLKSNLEQALLDIKISKEEEIFELRENLETLEEKFEKMKKEFLEVSSEIELLNLRRQKIGEEETINEKLYHLYKNKFEDSDYKNLLLKNELRVLRKKIRTEQKTSLDSLNNTINNDIILGPNYSGNMNIMNNFKDTENFLEGLLQTNKELEQEREQNKELAAKHKELFALRERIEQLEKLKNIRRLGLF